MQALRNIYCEGVFVSSIVPSVGEQRQKAERKKELSRTDSSNKSLILGIVLYALPLCVAKEHSSDEDEQPAATDL